ncbi:MAG: hypothetical protein QOD92_1509 [Acidimicrobiaceae bacterium]|jgi:hypothetical protein
MPVMQRDRMRSRLGLVLLASVISVMTWTLVFVGSAVPAAASCAGSPTVESDLERTDLVFVGTVTHLTNGNRWATFTVEDLWKGELASAQVDVHAGPVDPGGSFSAISSVDRHYDAGARYLVFAYDPTSHGYQPTWGTQSRFEDNICSATQHFTPELDRFRPASARRVEVPSSSSVTLTVPTPSTGSTSSWMLRVCGLAVVTAAGVGLVLRFRHTQEPGVASS